MKQNFHLNLLILLNNAYTFCHGVINSYGPVPDSKRQNSHTSLTNPSSLASSAYNLRPGKASSRARLSLPTIFGKRCSTPTSAVMSKSISWLKETRKTALQTWPIQVLLLRLRTICAPCRQALAPSCRCPRSLAGAGEHPGQRWCPNLLPEKRKVKKKKRNQGTVKPALTA